MCRAFMGTLMSLKNQMRTGNLFYEDMDVNGMIDEAKNVFMTCIPVSSTSTKQSTSPLHNPTSIQGGPSRTRLLSNQERKKIPHRNYKKKERCGFCLENTHRIGTCDSRKKWAQRIDSDTEMDYLMSILLDLNSEVIKTHTFNEEMMGSLKERLIIPNDVAFISISKKICVQATTNVLASDCVDWLEIYCLKTGGHLMDNYSPCRVCANTLLEWVNKKKGRRTTILWNIELNNSPRNSHDMSSEENM